MSPPRIPFKFETGQQLSPTHLIGNFQQIANDVTKSQNRHWTYDSFELDFTGLASGSNLAERYFTIKAPKGYEILALELEVYQAAGQTISITCSATNSTVCSVTTAGATTKARKYQKQNGVKVALDTAVTFTYSSTSGTNTACRCIVHFRSSRWSNATRTEYTDTSVLQIASGDTVSATQLNTEFSSIESAVTADSDATHDLKIYVSSYRNVGTSDVSTQKRDLPLPAAGRTWSRMLSYIATAASSSDVFSWDLLDQNAASVATSTISSTTGSATVQDEASTKEVEPITPDEGFSGSSATPGVIPTGTTITQTWGSQVWQSVSNTGGSITAVASSYYQFTGGGTTFVNQYFDITDVFSGKTMALRVYVDNVRAVETIINIPGYGLVQFYPGVPEVHNPTGSHFSQVTGAWFILVFQFNVGNTVSYIAGTAYTTTGSAMPTGAQQVRLGASAGNAAPEMRVSDVAVWDNVTVTDEQIRAFFSGNGVQTTDPSDPTDDYNLRASARVGTTADVKLEYAVLYQV